jgi:hypothetical protein
MPPRRKIAEIADWDRSTAPPVRHGETRKALPALTSSLIVNLTPFILHTDIRLLFVSQIILTIFARRIFDKYSFDA